VPRKALQTICKFSLREEPTVYLDMFAGYLVELLETAVRTVLDNSISSPSAQSSVGIMLRIGRATNHPWLWRFSWYAHLKHSTHLSRNTRSCLCYGILLLFKNVSTAFRLRASSGVEDNSKHFLLVRRHV
jgi:hypothetical protein